MLVSGGNSQALGQVDDRCSPVPGDVVFVECPTYNLALGIIADHPVDIVGVPLDAEGLDVDALERGRARGPGVRPASAPAVHHPDLPQPRRRQSVRAAPRGACSSWRRREDLVLVEDDVYRELVYEGEAPPALRALDPEAPVVRLGSFSKSLAPGLRLGWIDAPPPSANS